MDAERARAFLLCLPHVCETMQWGDRLVFWLGDKAVGGRMFTVIRLDAQGGPRVSFAAGAEHAAELCESAHLRPAPYLARAGWVAAESWEALREREWQDEFSRAHALILNKLPPRTRSVLEMPQRARLALIKERRRALAAAAKAKLQPK